MFHLINFDNAGIWRIVGFTGQFLFFMRFFVQWLASEKAKKSVIPDAFWLFSILGGSVVFVYAAFHLKDPVIALGQGMGLLIYFRNVYLLKFKKKKVGAA